MWLCYVKLVGAANAPRGAAQPRDAPRAASGQQDGHGEE